MDAAQGRSGWGVESASEGVQRMIATFRRRIRVFGLVSAVFLAMALVIILTRPAQYTSTATLALNPQKQPVVTATVTPETAPDSSAMDTEVEILRSRALAVRVAKDLKLDQDPNFNPRLRKTSIFQQIQESVTGLMPQDAKPVEPAAVKQSADMEAAVSALQRGLKVNRVAMTFLISVSFTSDRADKAAQIANGFARSYLASQLDSSFNANSTASDWLNGRLQQLRAQVEQADTELQQYKIANNLMSSQGATLTEQEISTLDQQLALTRAQEAEATARLTTAKRQLASGSTGEDVGEALSSPVIQQLRQQRAIASKSLADLQGRYGDRHPEMLKAKRELADIDTQIQDEVRRIISNLEAQAQVARQRTASIEGSVGQSRGKLAGNNRALVRLNELQRNSDAVRSLYETLLNRYKETSTEKGLQKSDARVVSFAATPQSPNGRISLAILMAALASLTAGVIAVIIAELLDNAISDGNVIENELNTSFLGSIPLLSSTIDDLDLIKMGPERYVAEKPLSSFAESIRGLNAAILFSQVGKQTKVVAVTSSLPGEGKTTSAICLARTLALSGKKVVLVDCDLRQHSVQRILTDQSPKAGLLELLNGDVTLDEVLLQDSLSSATILPVTSSGFTPRDVFGTPAMAELLGALREKFDVVVLDTAPVLLVTETLTIAAQADATVVVVRWRKTSKRAVSATLRLLKSANVTLAGAAISQVDLTEAGGISESDPAHYYREYKKYYLS